MPHVSRKKLKKKTLKKINAELLAVLNLAKNKHEFASLFYELITRTEKIMLAKRLAIILMLSKDIPQHRIVKALKVSPSTVAKMSLKLQIGKYKSVLKLSSKQGFGVLEFLEFMLSGAGMMPKRGRGHW
jgi:uncharacterized protein YerC